MPNILILSKNAAEYIKLLSAADLPGAVLLTPGQPLTNCEIVIGEPDRIRPVLEQLPDVKWIQSTWAGVEPLLDPALRRDYRLTNARGVFGRLMAEYVFSYLLLHERKILQRLDAQKQKRWDPTITGTLRGKTIGLLGTGSIGAEVARTAKFFEMTVRGYTRASEDSPDVDAYYHGNSLFTFANGLDYLISILPNTGETREIVNTALLAQLPPHALFMNVGRGSAVDEAALCDALRRGALAGAILDVFNSEPLPPEHPFWSTPNLLITSHSAAPSFPADIARLFIENYRRYVAGEPLKYQVDFKQGY
jgi:phosphoglycerate dehydrogenase-like enzyme